MLKPAQCYADEIVVRFRERFYTDDMVYYIGWRGSWVPQINPNEVGDSDFRFASVDEEGKLVGYISYQYDPYDNIAHNFGIMSFQKGNYHIGKDLYDCIKKILFDYNVHRLEFAAVSGNPVIRHYDKFAKLLHMNKIVMKDAFKDYNGNYHDRIVYEVLDPQQYVTLNKLGYIISK